MAFTVATFWPRYPRYDSNMPVEWVYKTNDTNTQVKADSYWNYQTNPRLAEVKQYDEITVISDMDGTLAVHKHVVLGIDTTNKVLQISDGTAISVANT